MLDPVLCLCITGWMVCVCVCVCGRQEKSQLNQSHFIPPCWRCTKYVSALRLLDGTSFRMSGDVHLSRTKLQTLSAVSLRMTVSWDVTPCSFGVYWRVSWLHTLLLTRLVIYKSGKPCYFNILKSTGHVMHQQFNIQQLYVLPTLYVCVLYLSQNKQRLVPLTA